MPSRKRTDVPDLLRGPTVVINVRVASQLARDIRHLAHTARTPLRAVITHALVERLARTHAGAPSEAPGVMRTPRRLQRRPDAPRAGRERRDG
jgi:hypothetical protein